MEEALSWRLIQSQSGQKECRVQQGTAFALRSSLDIGGIQPQFSGGRALMCSSSLRSKGTSKNFYRCGANCTSWASSNRKGKSRKFRPRELVYAMTKKYEKFSRWE